MGKKTFKEAAKVSKVYTTEELKELLKQNDHFTVREKTSKNTHQNDS